MKTLKIIALTSALCISTLVAQDGLYQKSQQEAKNLAESKSNKAALLQYELDYDRVMNNKAPAVTTFATDTLNGLKMMDNPKYKECTIVSGNLDHLNKKKERVKEALNNKEVSKTEYSSLLAIYDKKLVPIQANYTKCKKQFKDLLW